MRRVDEKEDTVANEAMRLRSVTPVVLMQATFDATVGDIEIPRGTILAIPPRVAALADEFILSRPAASCLSAGLRRRAERTARRAERTT